MKVTLKYIMKNVGFRNILELKLFLIDHKKTGRVFYHPDMTALQEEEEFELYFYLPNPQKSERNAFPMLREIYESNPPEDKVLQLCQGYMDEMDFLLEKSLFCNLEVYKGTEWVWFYSNNMLEGF
jgi:hypothetical protein